MGFCTETEYMEFLHSCPEFERRLVRAGIILIKYWLSVSDEEQERRFQDRMRDPTKRWKLSAMDVQSRARWAQYSRAKDEMFAVTDIKQAPWYVVNAEDKRCARLNLIRHLLSLIPYEDLTPEPIKLAALDKTKYLRPPIEEQSFIPEVYRRQNGLCLGEKLRSFAPADSPFGFAQGRLRRLSSHELNRPRNWQSGLQLFTMTRDGSRDSG